MALEEYRHKRRFERTPEPAGDTGSGGGPALSFVVQKHAATRLHYDFRLELDGVLLSWAVPKGPSLDPADKRLAVHVEDHPLEYGGFEGTIPKGEYGGGTVMVWDHGTWEPDHGDPRQHLAEGHLKFYLFGEKLRGKWMLVRTTFHETDSRDQWLLFKERDEEARPRAEYDVQTLDRSAVSGRAMEEITAAGDAVWHSSGGGQGGGSTAQTGFAKESRRAPDPSHVKGGKKAKLPVSVEVELATLVSEAPVGAEWVHEIKLDGYRAYCRIDGGKATFTSRNQNDWTGHYRALAEAAGRLPAKQAILDGEVVVLQADGTTSFQALQNALSAEPPRALTYMAFDLLYLDGYDLRDVELLERKRLLHELLGDDEGSIRYVDHVSASGQAFYQQACRFALEGVVSKRGDRPYRAGRGRDWQKVKCLLRQEFVVVGYTEPGAGGKSLGALLLGVRDGDELRYAGRVGTGFTDKSRADLRRRLEKMERTDPPVVGVPKGEASRGKLHWVEPRLVAEVAFAEWTGDGQLRHPSFQGLREDKPAEEVVVERAAAADEPAPRQKAERKAESTPKPKPKPKAKGERETIGGVSLSNPGRVLWPDNGKTKRDLAHYYEAVAEHVLPHIANRPLTLVRCPEGYTGQCFYQKHHDASLGRHVHDVPIPESKGVEEYVFIRDLQGLLELVQLGVLELHPWGSKVDQVEKPDRMFFDLDPDPALGWERLVEAATLIRARLEWLGLDSFVKTTGGKGLHVVAPLRRTIGWGDMKAFSKAIVDQIVGVAPELYTANMSKAKREGRIFIDYVRNSRGATAVAAFSTRARPGSPVSMPVAWDDLPHVRADQFTLENALGHLAARRKDPWERYDGLKQSITAKMRREMGIG